jgi:predicted dehydrogenase
MLYMSHNDSKSASASQITRRSFINSVAFAAAGITIVPRRVLGGPGFTAPSDIVNIAGIGASGRASQNLSALFGQNLVALADVDFSRLDTTIAEAANPPQQGGGGGGGNADPAAQAAAAQRRIEQAEVYRKAIRYTDYREMLEKQTDIDAVVITTPDHIHAHAAKMAMELGKHVYVEKPLTYSIREARILKETAARTGVVTQMGNQGHSGDGGRRAVELIQAGAIGPVEEVHIWTNRPIWPQGVNRPETKAPPANLNWDLFLGPAPEMPYSDGIHPFNWRGWSEFGAGALGDMGAHLFDHVFWALNPGMPTRIETRHSRWGGTQEDPRVTYPLATITYYEFGNSPAPIKMTWYDGGLTPPTPPEMPADRRIEPGGGTMVVGSRGKLIYSTYGNNPYLLPMELNAQYENLPQTLPRIEGSNNGHQMNFIRAIQGTEGISSPFEYASDLTELMLLGIVAMRAGTPIEYDARNMRITNNDAANQYLDRPSRRAGWEL